MLLEGIIAVVIITFAVLAIIQLIVECDSSSRRSKLAEQQLERADNFFQHVALWSRKELEQRIGNREQGQWRLQIDAEGEVLFRVSLFETRTAELPILETVLYRPADPSEATSVAAEN